ncbi:MAG: T9SS type A sorting domain-containing protein [Lewinellaceae bacterium]|nr:T9SS type A sorting domain-containing protein [Lewinellaceae bacterium]MCB9285937.1 T9SS type A sorting domain-containing protein [Lewinellaceae bacterium]
MQIRVILLPLFCLLAAFHLSAQQGEVANRSLSHDGTTRTYIVYVPQAYTGEEAWPLIISLHGYTGTAELQRLISNFEALADEEHFLIAYPQGLVVDDPSGGNLPLLPPQGYGWNILDPGGPDDLGFMAALIDSVSTEFNIDSGQVFAAGHSNGGALAYQMACELSGRIAAIASVGGPGTSPGLLPFFECNAAGPVPVLDIHGTADQVVPYNGVAGLFASIPATMEGWGSFNGCGAEPLVREIPNINLQDGCTATLIQYLDCEQGAEVWHFRVNGGGHWWPGSIPVPVFLEDVMGKVNRDFDASREIWNFFSGQPLTGLEEAITYNKVSLSAFPNPAGEEVTFSFSLSAPGLVRFRVYSLLGQAVAAVRAGQLPKGPHQLRWSIPAHLGAGAYLVVLETEGAPAERARLVVK